MGLNSIFALFGFPEGDKNPEELKKMKTELSAYKKTPSF
jgi:hypothetical protein